MLPFTPCPANGFEEFIETYYQRCRAAAPEIIGQAGKWKFEDLIPGLSDFDTRFLTRDGLKSADWDRISMAVGQVHLDLAQERHEWARTLEHLPGVNLSESELLAPEDFYPEFCQWTFYHAETERLCRAASHFAALPWTDAHATYHWKRIALYYDRYSRTIDPPINLGIYEGKYPLHSRFIHYLAPPVHSAVCLMDQKTTPGKLDAFRHAREVFPNADVMESILASIACHYETPQWYGEPGFTDLDDLLENYLRDVVEAVRSATGFDCPSNPAPNQLRAATAQLPKPAPLNRLFESVKFARFMRGRLWFYSHELAWFDSLPLIHIELARIGRNFLEVPLEIFSSEILRKHLDWKAMLEALPSCGFSKEEVALCRKFRSLADPNIPVSDYRFRARQIVDIYPAFLEYLEKLTSMAVGVNSRDPAEAVRASA